MTRPGLSVLSAPRIAVRTAWRRLTSMRTALILLFLLALGAVPGSLLPQRPLNPTGAAAYIRTHGGWGRLLDQLGMFDVFGSVWFAAIYLLLFVSLIGCLIPRIRVHARAVARKPLPAPRNLARLPESGSFATSASVDAFADVARARLGRRWRIARRTEPNGAVTLSAEKGYSRETGNLVFHISLLVSLVLIAVGRVYSYEGQLILRQGFGFCNQIYQYDTWQPGRLAASGDVRPAPFCIDDLTKFTATYTASGEPSEFRADVTYQEKTSSPVRRTAISVNHPLRISGDRVYLISHGFAPVVTVRMPDGRVLRDKVENFVPSVASTLFSEGAFKFPGAQNAKQDIGISGFFAPTPTHNLDGTIGSSSPAVHDPVLGIQVFEGDLVGNGEEQSVYTLDRSKMTSIGQANLPVGRTAKLKNGVTVTFDGWLPWASLQVSHDPAQGYLLVSALAMVLGLLGSLGVRRRRVWLRITPAAGPVAGSAAGSTAGSAVTAADAAPTVVHVGGLARSDSGNFSAEFEALLGQLRAAGETPPGTPDDQHDLHHLQDERDREQHPIGAGKD